MDTSIGGTHPVVLGSPRPILRESNAPSPMWDEIQDMPGEIFDIEAWGHPLAECWHDMDLNSVPDEEVAQHGWRPIA